MAIIPISDLPAASTAQLTDELPANQSGTTMKVTVQQMSTLLAGPIIAGTGTGSAKGGNANSVASGNYSFSFGNTTNTASGDYCVAFGNSHSLAGNHNYGFGTFVTTDSSNQYCAGFGTGHDLTGGGDFIYAFGNSCFGGSGSNAFLFGQEAMSGSRSGVVVMNDSNGNSGATNDFQVHFTFENGYWFTGGPTRMTGIQVTEGSNAKQGTVALAAGVGVVSNTSVTANSRIMYNGQDANVTGFLTITARTTGSGFTITSSVNTDTGVVAYEIFEPAA